MLQDIRSIGRIYQNFPQRRVVRVVHAQLTALWPDVSRQGMLVFGCGIPLAPAWLQQEGFFAVSSCAQEAQPSARAPLRCAILPTRFPFQDETFDRILIIQPELSEAEVPLFLRNVWRVMKEDGRMALVVTNPRGPASLLGMHLLPGGNHTNCAGIIRALTDMPFYITVRSGASLLLPRCKATQQARQLRPPSLLSDLLLLEVIRNVHAALPLTASQEVYQAPPSRVISLCHRNPYES